MLSDDEDEFAPAMPAPTTAPLQKASKKSLRKAKVRQLVSKCCNAPLLLPDCIRGVQALFRKKG